MTIGDVYSNHFHCCEYLNGDLYIIRRIGYVGSKNSKDLHIRLLEWSKNGDQIWGEFIPSNPGVYYKINTSNWSIDKYDISQLGIGSEYDLNYTSGKIAFSNYPDFFDVDGAKEYEKSGAKVNLKVYDLKTNRHHQVASSNAKRFEPKWIGSNTLEYNDPNSQKRIQQQMKK